MRKSIQTNLLIGLILIFPLIFVFVTSSCKKSEEPQPITSQFSKSQLSARFPYDLGPASVDVTSYPEEIKQKYKLFLAVCSACHTSARPLNAPLVSAYDWKRFVHRMHMKMESREIPLVEKDAKEIVEFLVYDSKVRKIDRKKEFETEQEGLKKLFEEVSKERERVIGEEVKRLPKKETPYVGVK